MLTFILVAMLFALLAFAIFTLVWELHGRDTWARRTIWLVVGMVMIWRILHKRASGR